MDNAEGAYYSYIIRSLVNGMFYIGSTGNLEDRLQRHNQGRSKFTKPYRPFELVYSKSFQTKSEAVQHELKLKSMKSREHILRIINEGS